MITLGEESTPEMTTSVQRWADRLDDLPRTPDGHVDLRADYRGHVIDYVAQQDAKWFKEHPHEDELIRPPYEDEWSPVPNMPGVEPNVIVTQLRPGLRSRGRLMVITDPEAHLAWLQDPENKKVWDELIANDDPPA